MNRQDTSQINQSTDYHKSFLNLCKVNILQKGSYRNGNYPTLLALFN